MSVLSVVYRTPRKTSFADGAFLSKIKFIYLSIYSLVLIHYSGTGKCGRSKVLADKAVRD